MKYRLSNRQQKELAIRGQQLTIAIPTFSASDGDSPLAYAKRCLPEHSDMIADADTQLIVSILPGIGDGVARILGTIADVATISPGSIPVAIECAVVTIRPPRCRGESGKVQWPGMLIDGDKAKSPQLSNPS